MKTTNKIYSFFQMASAILMMLAILWLSLSTPFVYASQQEFARQMAAADKGSPLTGNEEGTNPFGNSTEEKAPCSTSFSEEYLHTNQKADYLFSIILRYYNSQNAGTYIAFHGELIVPPPNAV